MVKKTQRLKRESNLYLTENRLSGKEMWCAVENNNYIFHEISPNFTFSKNVILKVYI